MKKPNPVGRPKSKVTRDAKKSWTVSLSAKEKKEIEKSDGSLTKALIIRYEQIKIHKNEY